jgi:hypothetical protein
MIKLLLILSLFLIFNNAITIIWTGDNDTYWHNPKNWNPMQIPTSDDDVLITLNSSIPPYADQPLFVRYLKNDFLLDIYGTTAKMESLDNSGSLNIYNSQVVILNPFDLTGRIKIIESTVTVPFVTLLKNGFITGDGTFNTLLYNQLGNVKIEPDHVLTFQGYYQDVGGSLNFMLGNNNIITNYCDLNYQCLFIWTIKGLSDDCPKF